MRRVLIVAYYFPPLGGIGSLRVCSFARHLPEFGWEPTVLAPRDGAYYRDPELVFPESRVVRTPSLELSRTGKRVLRTGGGDTTAARVTGGRAVLRDIARRTLYFPDPQIGWLAPAVATARRALRDERFDAIISSSFPITSHLVARRLHRRLGVPWIAEFRDPWSEMMAAGDPARRRAARLERAIADEADGIVMTSPSWAQMHGRAWNREVTVLPNGYEEPLAGEPPNAGEFTLGYLGSYYPATQQLSAAWDAVAAVNGSDGAHVHRLRFIGELHPTLRLELRERGLEPLAEVTGFLPHRDALDVLRRSSALLVAGPRNAEGILRGQVAAKLSEYLATDLPIVYVGDLRCDAADLLRRYPGTHAIDRHDTNGVIQALAACRGQRVQREVEALRIRTLTGRLAELLDMICGTRSSAVSAIA